MSRAGEPITTFDGTLIVDGFEMTFACEDGAPVDYVGSIDCHSGNAIVYGRPWDDSRSAPENVWVDVRSASGTFSGWVILDDAEVNAPNGRDCGPICYVAERTVVLRSSAP